MKLALKAYHVMKRNKIDKITCHDISLIEEIYGVARNEKTSKVDCVLGALEGSLLFNKTYTRINNRKVRVFTIL